MPRPPLPLLLACAAAVGLAGCGGSSDDSGGSATPAKTAPAGLPAGCKQVAQPRPKPAQKLPRPKLTLSPSKTYVATIATSCGSFDITLDVKDSPKTSASFASLAGKRFYDGTSFHRIVPGFVIQGGDPKGDGSGGPGYKVVEAPPRNVKYTPGVVAMAKTQFEASGTSGSQFFVVTGTKYQFAPEYALLGKVSGGQATVDRIAAVHANPRSGTPVSPVVIDSVRVAPR
ncbi:MAG TPA: peptidylprolyl isomerase [Solirubrobacteraceae bacterium]|jgi:cyclophilin family peptidyl-prolyl cis-trans isomerase|nr:peptidylprolyl isomerase [Solirubrobacteraceae bacterium]